MNISKILFSIIFLSVFVLLSCEEEENVELYEQESISLDDSKLVYEKLTAYPLLGPIQSTEPTGTDFETPYRFRLLKISSTTDSSFVPAAFSIDPESGVLAYNNTNNTIGIGTFSVDVGVANTNGMAVKENAFELTILDVPATINIDISEVEAGIFEQGVMATVSYTDNSGSAAISSATYSLINPPAGFEINSSTGAISKVSGAISGPNSLSVRVTTNIGVIIAENLLTVNVGEAPTIEMFQQDGSTLLTKTVLSPNTAYTTSAPVVTGMNPTNWEIIFPTSLVNSEIELGEIIDFSASFSVEEPSGKVSITADADLPIGIHTMSFKAINATGSEYTFTDVFTIEVEERWDATPIYEDDFSSQSSQLTFHKMGSTSEMVSVREHPKSDGPVMRFGVFNPPANYADGAAEFKISVQGTTLKKLRISFYEIFGYNDWWVNRYKRTISSYQSVDDTSSLDPSEWNLIDAAFSSNARFGETYKPWTIDKYNPVTGDAILVDSTAKNVSFFIRLQYVGDTLSPVGPMAGGQWLLRNLKIEGSKAFDAEEE